MSLNSEFRLRLLKVLQTVVYILYILVVAKQGLGSTLF